MGEFWEWLKVAFDGPAFEKWFITALRILAGGVIAKTVAVVVYRVILRTGRSEIAMLGERVVFLSLLALVVFGSLKAIGVDLSVMLGAAGILTVALGFASQTSASNVISGVFLIGERPFVAGDIIQIGETKGEVLSVDLVSIKLRTYDNLLVRIPNESLFKSEIWNLTHYPIRRYTFYLHFNYSQDLDKLRELLLEVAFENRYVLDEPKPLIMVTDFMESSIRLQYSVWGLHTELAEINSTIFEDLKRKFDKEGVAYGAPRSEVRVVTMCPEAEKGDASSEEVVKFRPPADDAY